MTSHRYPFLGLCLLVAVIAGLSKPGQSDAQKPPPPGASQAPNVAIPMPLGMQRGTTLELTLTGGNLADPIALLTSIPGLKATFPTDNNNGKDNAKLRVVLEVPKEAPLGYHSLRLVTGRGISNLRLFCIDDLPQVVAAGTNKTKEAAQAVPVPSVVASRVDAESSTFCKITVQAGQRVSFDVIGRRLGSPIDPVIAVVDPRNQREVAYSNDAPGLQTDACMTHTFKEAGEYLVEVRDVMHRGGADFVYRLRIGDFPCATTPIPLAAKRGSKISVGFAGPNVAGVAPVEVTVPADPALGTVWVAPRGGNGLHGWPVALAVSNLDEAAEQEPNNEPAKATRIPVPGGVSGQFQQKGDVDHYLLPLKKGRWIIEAHTLELYSPTEVYMVLKDGKGAAVATSNPAQPPRFDYTAAADGDFTLMVEHLHYWGGPTESYRITVTPYEPGFDVALGVDRFDVPQGSAAIVPIQSVAARDYKGPIELSVVGHPGITGTKVIDSLAKAPQPNQPIALMLVTAAPDVPMGGYPLKVQAKAKVAGQEIVSLATVRPVVSQALGGLPYPPRQLIDQLAVGVTEKPPFTLTAKFEHPQAIRGGSSVVTITATRADGFDAEIALTAVGLPPNVAPALKNIPKGANDVKSELKPAANAPLGEFPISFQGKAKHQNKDFNVVAPPLPFVLALPFDLKVEPAPLKIDTSNKAKLKIVAVRNGGYTGPINLEIRGLPTGVTAPKTPIEANKNEVEIEITADAKAVIGDKTDVNVLGIATGAANQQNASANFTLTVNQGKPGATAPPPPQPAPAPKLTKLVPAGADGWRYFPAAQIKGDEWRSPTFKDDGWQTGKAPLGNGEEEIGKRKGTEIAQLGQSFLFRRAFDVPGDLLKQKGVAFRLQVASDDNAVVYVNGALADQDPEADHEFSYWNRDVELPAKVLRPGRNVVAVQVNNKDGSSDLYLDLEIVVQIPAAGK